MGIGLWILLGFSALVIITIGWVIGMYNMLVMALQTIKNQWSNIKTEYQRRADLILNLAESVKSYKKFEKSTMVELAAARSGKFGNTTAEEMKKMKGLEGVFGRLIATYENYPDLKSNTVYMSLMDELKMTENRVNIARTDYNELVRDYNILIRAFPGIIFARMFGYADEQFFELDNPADAKSPRIKLD